MTKDTTTESGSFSDAEREAMKQRAGELRAQKGGKKKEANLTAVLDVIEALPEDEKAIGVALHRIVSEVAPDLEAKTYYGMPAYARDGAVLVFLQQASKFETRYSTLGFNDNAALDEGDMWAASYAVPALTSTVEERMRELVARATAPQA